MLPQLAVRIPPQVRSYVTSVSPPRIYPGKKTPRGYSVRKKYLFDQYTALLNRDTPLLFLNHNNFSAKQIIKLRRDIAAVKASSPPSLALSPAPVSPVVSPPPELIVIRTGILGVALREHLGLEQTQKRSLAKLITPGAVAALTLPALDPPQLARLIRVLERAVPPRKPPLTREQEVAAREAARLAIIENPTPGRRQKRFRPDLPPELELKGALIEGRLFIRDQLRDVSKLPTLESLRSQILGLISAPAAQLAGVLGQAAGGQLARTLEGFKKGLEMDAEGDDAGGQQ